MINTAMSRRTFVASAVGAAALLGVVGLPEVAHAATSSSMKKTIDGRQYTVKATAQTLGDVGYTFGTISTSAAVAAGRIGVESRLFRAGGNLASAAKVISKKKCASVTAGASYKIPSNAYVKGVQATATGFVWRPKMESYTSFTCAKTPYAMASKAKTQIEYDVNEADQTFGNLYLATVYEMIPPDLVAAEGISGQEGYIYYADLEATTPSSPEEAVRMAGGASVRIPVYLADGVTKIDEFEVHFE